MRVDKGSFRKSLINEGGARGTEMYTHGVIGKVVHYHPKANVCDCPRHRENGGALPKEEMHSVDVDVLSGTKIERLYGVPCFVYSQGVIDHGFKPNDRVYIQFVNGDKQYPIAIAYYREPDTLELFWNNLRFGVGRIFKSLLPDF